MPLNCEKKTMFVTDYSDVEDLISEVYDADYEIMPMEEVGSSQYDATYNVTAKKAELTDHDRENIESLRIGKPKHYMLHSLITDLTNNNHMEEGNYSISVTW